MNREGLRKISVWFLDNEPEEYYFHCFQSSPSAIYAVCESEDGTLRTVPILYPYNLKFIS